MVDYHVKLDIYNGPLDLLLYLIRRNEVEIHDIPISQITDQYLQYVELIKQLDINLAGEFLVMAATLMEIKSALLLPRDEAAEGEEDDLSDPRLELVRQLLEYKNFKDAAGELSGLAQEQSGRFARPLTDLERIRHDLQKQQELDLESLQIWDLFDAFNRMMQATLAGQRSHEVVQDDTPIDLYEADILDRAQNQSPLTFEAVFAGCANRLELVGLFLALLELIRMKLVRIEQELDFKAIYIFALTDEPAELAVAHAVSADIDTLPSEKIRAKETHHDESVEDTSQVSSKDASDQHPVNEDGGRDQVPLNSDDVTPPAPGGSVRRIREPGDGE
jgi:segregation and condensation protein A